MQFLQYTNTTSTTITISWVLGFDGGESIDNVIVSFATADDDSTITYEASTTLKTVTTHTLVNLQPLTRYNITVVAVNAIGSSSPSTITLVQTNPLSK